MEDNIYDTQTLEAMEHFHRVWSRVASAPVPLSVPLPLQKLPVYLRLLHLHYSALAKHYPGHPHLRHMMQETAYHCRAAMAEHYIREGQLPPPARHTLPSGKRELLRSTVLLEDELTELCHGSQSELLRQITNASSVRRRTAMALLATCF